MKEHLDSNRVNFLIWRYVVTCFPSPVPDPHTSLHAVFARVPYSLRKVLCTIRLAMAPLTFET